MYVFKRALQRPISNSLYSDSEKSMCRIIAIMVFMEILVYMEIMVYMIFMVSMIFMVFMIFSV